MRRILCLAVCLVGGACGGGPSSPSDPMPGVQLPDGRYVLQIVAPLGFQGCAPVPDVPFSVVNVSKVRLTREADAWVARAETALDGDVELRFRAVAAGARSVALSGTILGTAITANGSDGIIGVGASFGDSGTPATQVTGAWFSTTTPVIGKLTGAIGVILTGRTLTTCPTADWNLLRAGGF